MVLVLAASAARADVALRRGTVMTPAAGTGSRALKLVQFGSAPTDDDVRALEAAGARVVQSVPRNAFLVWAPDRAAEALGDSIATRSRAVVVSAADFQPRDAIAPKLDRAATRNEQAAVTVQFYAGAGTLKRDLRAARRAGRVLRPARRVLGNRYVNLRLLVPGTNIQTIADLASVVNVEPYLAPRLYDERQGQILAANLDGLGQTPSSPGYLGWLAGHGFPTSPSAYPVTVVVDDGIDNGTVEPTNSEFREGNDPLGASRVAFAVLPPGSNAASAEGPEGHGNINASILAGFNDATDPAVADGDGTTMARHRALRAHRQRANLRTGLRHRLLATPRWSTTTTRARRAGELELLGCRCAVSTTRVRRNTMPSRGMLAPWSPATRR